MTETIKRKLATIPTKPGVYLHKDARGKVLYVGKAKNLRNRIRSYFQGGKPHDAKTTAMLSKVEDFEVIIARSEVEALLIESNFIKQYRPPYNVVLRDDKQYVFIKVTLGEAWPRVHTTRNTTDTTARYFGPFTNAGDVRSNLKTLRRVFPWCDDAWKISDVSANSRPCFSYRLGFCPGACIGEISEEDYRALTKGLIRFLEGHGQDVSAHLQRQMEEAAKAQKFEQAAFLRDKLRQLTSMAERQQAIGTRRSSRDVVGYTRDEGQAVVVLMSIRDGKVVARKQFTFWGSGGSTNEEVLDSFLGQYYKVATDLPREVLLPFPVPNGQPVEALLTDRRGRKSLVIGPKRGDGRKLLDLAHRNAEEFLRQLREAWQADQTRTAQALDDLQEKLKLDRRPERIECYDISNLTGTSTVGSMVVFVDGLPCKEHYRRFQIKHVKGIDDFASMQEVLSRRFNRISRDEKKGGDDSFGTLPDLIIIDGGKGQVSAARTTMRELSLENVPLIGLAKRLEEVITYDGTDFSSQLLPHDSQGLYLLQRIRDEAHRFAITYNRNLRSKRSIRSALDEIPGIGPVKKKQLMRTFGSVKAIREADVVQIQEVVGQAAGRVVKENL